VSHVVYGLCPGSSDLIGIASVLIQPEHVGRLFGRFVGIELKAKGGKPSKDQEYFRALVNRMGGHAVIMSNPLQAESFLCNCRK